MTDLPRDKLNAIIERQPEPLLFVSISGSHIYGYSSADSDFDLRGAHILPVKEMLGLRAPRETFQYLREEEGLELDLETHDIKKYFQLLLKRNGNILEQVLSPLVLYQAEGFEELKALTLKCLTKHHAHHYRGLARTHWKKIESGAPLKAKTLLYVYRALLAGIHLMTEEHVEPNLGVLNERHLRADYISELIEKKSKAEEHSLIEEHQREFHWQKIQELRKQLDDAQDSTRLPDKSRAGEALEELLIRLRFDRSQVSVRHSS